MTVAIPQRKIRLTQAQYDHLILRRYWQQRIRLVTGYEPHTGGQAAFHEAIDFGATRLAGMTGRRWGKTMSNADECVIEMPFGPIRSLPIRHVWVTGPEFDITDPVFEYCWHWLVDKRCINGIKPIHASARERYIQFPWNARISCLTTKNPDSLQGKGVIKVINDESADTQEGILEQYLEPVTLDTNGIVSLISTPDGRLNQFTKTHEDWTMKAEADPRYYTYHATSYDNPYNDRVLLDAYREDCERKGKIELFNQEILARIVSMSGAIYPMFQPTLDGIPWHVQEIEPIEDVAFEGGIDWGFTNPFCFLLAQVKDDIVYVYDEIYQSGLTDPDQVSSVSRMVDPAICNMLFCDPSGAGAKQLFKEAGFGIFEPSSSQRTKINSVQQGIVEVRSLFSRLDKPAIIVHPKCVNLIKELQNYKINPRANDEKPEKVNDHACDALRYLVMGAIGVYIEPPVMFF